MKNSLYYIKENIHSAVKKFGQNFLIDTNIINKIVNGQKIDKETCVIEIGPGLGSLTQKLVEKAQHVIVYEIDKKLVSILVDNFKEFNNIEINCQDFLQLNFANIIKKLKKKFKRIVVVSNLPYYASSQLIVQVLSSSDNIESCVFMMQKEFGERLTAKISTKKYNNFSILVQHYAEIKKLFIVPPTVFVPKPKVDSIVFKFKIRKDKLKIENEKKFFSFLKQMFAQKRKTILNNLSNFIHDKEKAKQILFHCDIDPKLRPENLKQETFLSIYKML